MWSSRVPAGRSAGRSARGPIRAPVRAEKSKRGGRGGQSLGFDQKSLREKPRKRCTMEISLARNIYRPTSSEEKKCANLLMTLHLPVATYDRYRRQAQAFLSLFAHHDEMRRASTRRSGRSNASPAHRAPPAISNGITNFAMRRSDLFGREYLVAYADAAWLREIAPGNDAITSPCATFNFAPSPALVLIPGSRKKADDPAFLSILEHEFVHIHQILLGTFPDSELDTADKCLREILRIARAEYEANLIELIRWPRLYSGVHARHGISLEDFCTLRGYTQGLQRIFGS